MAIANKISATAMSTNRAKVCIYLLSPLPWVRTHGDSHSPGTTVYYEAVGCLPESQRWQQEERPPRRTALINACIP